MELSHIFNKTTEKVFGLAKLAKWQEKVRQFAFKALNTIARSIQNHYTTILNFFINRTTNASAESFNAKTKSFGATSRGARDVKFFLFRLSKIYA